MKGKPLPDNERAIQEIAYALRVAVAAAPHNSIITLMVKIDARGQVSPDSSMDLRRFPLRDDDRDERP